MTVAASTSDNLPWLSRSKSFCDRRTPAQRLLCSAEVIPSKFSEGQKVCSLICFAESVTDIDRILIVLDLDVLTELGECEKIGEPKPLETKAEEEKIHSTTISSNGFYGSKHQSPQPQPMKSGMFIRNPTVYE